MASKRVFGIVTLVILVFGARHVTSLTKPTSIKLTNNAYTGIVVAIHRDVPEDQKLLDIIKVCIIILTHI